MAKKIKEVTPPSGCSRLFFRAPIWLYRLGLGRLLGNRMLLLHHKGRITGLSRKAVLEVVRYDPLDNSYVVNAGFGPQSDWYRNVMANPEVAVESGGRTDQLKARRLTAEEGAAAMLAFAHKHPRQARLFAPYLGYRVNGSDDDWRALGRELIFVAFEKPGP